MITHEHSYADGGGVMNEQRVVETRTFGHKPAITNRLTSWYASEERRTRERLARQFLAHYRALADALNETDAALLVAMAKREVGER